MQPAVKLVWKLWTVYAHISVVTAIMPCIIKVHGLFKSKWRHFQNVKFEALSACMSTPIYGKPLSLKL